MPPSPLAALREVIRNNHLDGLLVPRADEHLGEYVPANAERLAWLTGFTGSAGLAIVLAERAAAFTDGRYVLQLAAQTDANLWERHHITDEPPQQWLALHAPGQRIGYDAMLFSEEALARYRDAGVLLVATEGNLVDRAWTDRPAPPLAPAIIQPLAFAGESSATRRERIAAALRQAGEDAAVLSDPASIAWLLNIRGSDVPFTPFALGFATLHADGGCELFMAPGKLPPPVRDWLGNRVAIAPRDALPAALARLAGKRVRVDPAGAPAWFAQTLRAAGATVVAGMDPCLLPKACKNAVEQQGSRTAHARDAVAVCRFLHWLEGAGPRGESEMSAAARLLALRAELEDFRGESFPAISGCGPNGAVIHYRVSEASNRAFGENELYLIDSGAQFGCGTTDITRTVWTGPSTPPAAVRDRVTRVLKGHIALATLVFPEGACGAHLDGFARHALWQAGLDYDHGTGHGVGSYLSVHEGPVSLSRLAKPVALAPGMILSNEPGYYLPGAYGVRLENLLLVERRAFPAATRPFLGFETLSLAPFDRRLIEPALLTEAERGWLDAYHVRVLAEVGPHLPAETRAWLETSCVKLAA